MPDNPKVNAQAKDIIDQLLVDRPVAYHPMVAKAVGSLTAGVFLAQILYWTPRSTDPEGWVWKTQEELYDETALSRFEQEGARKKLVSLGVLQERKRGLPAKLWFRVDFATLRALLAALPADKDAEIQHPRMRKTSNLAWRKAAPKDAEIPHTNSEITSETSSEITYSDSESESASPFDFQTGQGRGVTAGEPPHQPVTTSQSPPVSSSSVAPPSDAGSVDAAIAEVSQTLTGGRAELASHQTQARKLWQQSGLSPSAFAVLVADVCSTVQQQRRRVHKPMAYFFRCLRDRLDHDEVGSSAAADAPEPTEEQFAVLPEGYNAQRLWRQARKRLADRLPRPSFETYLAQADAAEVVDGHLVVYVDSDITADQLDTKLRPTVSQAIAEEFGLPVFVEFLTSSLPHSMAL